MREDISALRAEAALPVIAKVLRTLKHTEDATPTPATAQLHALCDMALGLAQVRPALGHALACLHTRHPGVHSEFKTLFTAFCALLPVLMLRTSGSGRQKRLSECACFAASLCKGAHACAGAGSQACAGRAAGRQGARQCAAAQCILPPGAQPWRAPSCSRLCVCDRNQRELCALVALVVTLHVLWLLQWQRLPVDRDLRENLLCNTPLHAMS